MEDHHRTMGVLVVLIVAARTMGVLVLIVAAVVGVVVVQLRLSVVVKQTEVRRISVTYLLEAFHG